MLKAVTHGFNPPTIVECNVLIQTSILLAPKPSIVWQSWKIVQCLKRAQSMEQFIRELFTPIGIKVLNLVGKISECHRFEKGGNRLERAGDRKVTQGEGDTVTAGDVWFPMAMNLNIEVTSKTMLS
jgi:hypothetical protein